MTATAEETKVIAHRGFCGIYPENSVHAITAMDHHSAAAIELDVLPSKDGVPVVCHDETLKRISGTKETDEKLWDMSCSEITDTLIFQTDQTIPTLETALDVLPNKVDVHIELKNPGIDTVYTGRCPSPEVTIDQIPKWIPFIENVVNILDQSGTRYMIASSREACIAATYEIDKNIDTIYFTIDDIRSGWTIANQYDCSVLSICKEQLLDEDGRVNYNSEFVSNTIPDLVEQSGIDIHVWTVTNWLEACSLDSIFVDAILADYPKLLDFNR